MDRQRACSRSRHDRGSLCAISLRPCGNRHRLADAYDVAGDRALTPHCGKGAVVEGLDGDEVRRNLESTLHAFTAAGFDGGFFIIQSVSKADDKQFDLQKLDELFTFLLGEQGERSRLLTTYCEASASGVMAISFKKAILKQERQFSQND